MRPNARRTTLADIARAAGVSVATVSKVVNGRGDVAPHTRIRVQELLHQHHYLAPVFRHTEAAESPTIEVQFKGGLKSYLDMRDGPFQPEPMGPRSAKGRAKKADK